MESEKGEIYVGVLYDHMIHMIKKEELICFN